MHIGSKRPYTSHLSFEPLIGVLALSISLCVPVLHIHGFVVPILLVIAFAAAFCALLSKFPISPLAYKGLGWGGVAYTALLLAGPAADAAHQALVVLANPYGINPMEGEQALRIWLVAHGRTVYSSMNDNPYLATVYPPLFYVASTPFVWFGLKPLLAGRLISSFSAIVVFLTAACWTKKRTGRLITAALVALALAGHRYGFEYAHLCRVDFLSWALFFTSIVFILKALDNNFGRGRKFFLVAAILMLAAVFTKQQIALYAGGLVLWIIVFRRDRVYDMLLYFIIPALLAGVAAFGFLHYILGNDFFINVILYPKRMSADSMGNTTASMIIRLGDFYRQNIVLILLWVTHLCYSAIRRKISPLDFTLLCNLPILILSLRWYGADANYFIGPVIILYCGIAESLTDLWERPFGRALVLGALVFITVPGPISFDRWSAPIATQKQRSIKQEALGAAMNQAEGNALVESESGYLALDSRATYFDGIELNIFERAFSWDMTASKLFTDVSKRRFARIIEGSGFIPQKFREVMEHNYTLQMEVDGTRIYVPRDLDAILTVTDANTVTTSDPGLSASIRLVNAKKAPDEDCLTPYGAPEARVMVEIHSERPIKALSVLFFPRINQGIGNGFALEGRIGDGQMQGLYALPGNGSKEWTPIGGIRQEARLVGSGHQAELYFILRNSAQLWLETQNPMRIFVAYQ